MELASASVRQRMDYKEDLIRQLIAGRLTLQQVSEEFLRVNRQMEMPEVMNQIRLRYAGSGDEEKIARNVLEFVETRWQPGADVGEVRERLHREFADRFGHRPDTAD